jgi:glycine dehydrogenase subunit 1
MTTIFLTVYGKEGIRELALQNLAKARYAADTFGGLPGAKLLFKDTPRFHEFVLHTEESVETVSARLLEKKIIGGLPLAKWYPELGNASLWCATELTTREQIDSAADVLADAAVAASRA